MTANTRYGAAPDRLRRRLVVVAGLLACAYPALAQTRAPARIAMLLTGTPESHGYLVKAFVDAMHDAGYTEGRDVIYAYYWAGGRSDMYPSLAAKLAEGSPDIVVTGTAASTRAAAQAAPRAAIVMAYGSDPVGNKLIASLARPGGRITGLSNLGEGLVPKMLELLRSLVPNGRRFVMIVNPVNLSSAAYSADAEAAASGLKLSVSARSAPTADAVRATLEQLKHERPDGILVTPDPMFLTVRGNIVDSVTASRIPAIYFQREFVVAGGLVCFGSSIRASFARAANFVDKIMKGADPATMPVEQPAKFELVLNARTAKSLGLVIPQSVLLRADEVIL